MKLLLPLSWLYHIGLTVNQALYRHGLKKSTRVSVPVICIGNLSVGGTGKTPMVEYTVNELKALGMRPAVVSRGYRRKTPAKSVVVVSDGADILADVESVGDEPLLLARRLPQTAVAVCADRALAANELIRRGLCDCIVLDDGFQHLALRRDADIVLLDATRDLASMHLLPAGRLREPPAALSRAAAVVHTRSREGTYLKTNQEIVSRAVPDAEQFTASFELEHLRDISVGSDRLPLDTLRGKKVLAAAGIGNPEAFFQSLAQLGAEVVPLPLPDHAAIDAKQIGRTVVDEGCRAVVMTEKDWVKLPQPNVDSDVPWYVAVGRTTISAEDKFRVFLRHVVNRS